MTTRGRITMRLAGLTLAVLAVAAAGFTIGWHGSDGIWRRAWSQGWSAGARAVAGYLMPGYEDEVIERACEEQHKHSERSER